MTVAEDIREALIVQDIRYRRADAGVRADVDKILNRLDADIVKAVVKVDVASAKRPATRKKRLDKLNAAVGELARKSFSEINKLLKDSLRRLAKIDVDVRRLLGMEALQADRDSVRATDAHIDDIESPLRVGHRRIARPGGLVDRLDIDARQRGIVRIGHDTGQGTGGDLSKHRARAERQSEAYTDSGCESHGSPPKRWEKGGIQMSMEAENSVSEG